MGKSKTIPLPMYDELDENAYNTANRNMVNNLGEWLSDNYQSIGSLNQDQEQEYKDIANKASESSWSDFNRQLAKAQDTRNAISYNRFGSLTNTPALYEQETFGREANKAALELANNITDYYIQWLIKILIDSLRLGRIILTCIIKLEKILLS